MFILVQCLVSFSSLVPVGYNFWSRTQSDTKDRNEKMLLSVDEIKIMFQM